MVFMTSKNLSYISIQTSNAKLINIKHLHLIFPPILLAAKNTAFFLSQFFLSLAKNRVFFLVPYRVVGLVFVLKMVHARLFRSLFLEIYQCSYAKGAITAPSFSEYGLLCLSYCTSPRAFFYSSVATGKKIGVF